MSLATGQSKRFSNVSSAQRPALSLWVVMTSWIPRMAAMSRVSSLAPPTCPLSTEMTFFPSESIQTTAGSSCLSLMKGAIVRTQIPKAPMNTKASNCVQFVATESRHTLTAAGKCCCKVAATVLPASLICIMAILFIFLVGILRVPCSGQA